MARATLASLALVVGGCVTTDHYLIDRDLATHAPARADASRTAVPALRSDGERTWVKASAIAIGKVSSESGQVLVSASRTNAALTVAAVAAVLGVAALVVGALLYMDGQSCTDFLACPGRYLGESIGGVAALVASAPLLLTAAITGGMGIHLRPQELPAGRSDIDYLQAPSRAEGGRPSQARALGLRFQF
jgi:hypothetical protein